MTDIDLNNNKKDELAINHFKIIGIDKVDDFLSIALDNGQKILTDGNVLYDVSDFGHLKKLFHMGDKFCAVMIKCYAPCLIDLNNMEILFEDSSAYHISKKDERTINVLKKIGGGNDTIYDIETRKYLPAPENYEFENSLGNNLYVFREVHKDGTNFYDYKRCVINADGKMILDNIDGWVELKDNFLIVKKKDKLCVTKINEDGTLCTNILEQNEEIIAKPDFINGFLVIMEKGTIKIYTPALELVKVYLVDELQEIIDYEIISNVLKLCLPNIVNGEKASKHLYINLENGKSISHTLIEPYPYWSPTTYIGQDTLNTPITDFHFYNNKFEKTIEISAKSYESVDSKKECMFTITTLDGKNEQKKLLNTENGKICDIDYGYVKFHTSLPYGYGVNFDTEKIDFFDENLNIIFSNFDYKKFDIRPYHGDFSYFIVNNYLCVQKHFVGNHSESRWRTIIIRSDGEIILDSINHECYALGNLIQIIHNNSSEFLNTITGEIGPLEITAPTSSTGKIDFRSTSSIGDILSITDTSSIEEQKIKKL